ncbi:MAG: hypothetical protein AAGD04_17640 [Pseudomonadota bacterium]
MVKTANIHANAALVAFIRETKKACSCAKADVQFIWNQFRSLNLKNGHTNVPVRWLMRFIEVLRMPGDPKPAAQKLDQRTSATVAEAGEDTAKPEQAASDPKFQMMQAQSPAKYEDLGGLERSLVNLIGAEAFKDRVSEAMKRYRTQAFQARWAVLGEAVTGREIRP